MHTTTHSIRALLTDLDGVIRLWDPHIESTAEAECGLPLGALRQAAFAPDLLTLAITGQITDAAWRHQITTRMQVAFPMADVAKAVQLWSAPAGAIDAAILDLVRRCRQKVRVILVTNATSRLPSDLARLGIETEFDHIINSSVVGHCKPQPEIFQAALAVAGVAATELFFVDDSASHVAAAGQLGIAGHVYRGTIDALKADLQRYDLL